MLHKVLNRLRILPFGRATQDIRAYQFVAVIEFLTYAYQPNKEVQRTKPLVYTVDSKTLQTQAEAHKSCLKSWQNFSLLIFHT